MSNANAPAAVIDLGTNTFHLLIFEKSEGKIKHLFTRQIAVKLGEGGINERLIIPEAFERGLKALEEFTINLKEYGVTKIKALATSAIRNARNSEEFISEVKSRTGITIEMIDGKTEADYIYKGVMQTISDMKGPYVIMDIGGGSVEFIIVDDHNIRWYESFEIGAARLLERFHKSDPITKSDQEKLDRFLQEKLQPLFEKLKEHKVQKLIGSAGSFESIYDIINNTEGGSKNIRFSEIKLGDYMQLHSLLLQTTLLQRKRMRGMASYRAEMMVVSSCLIHSTIKHTGINHIYFSGYSLKEGVASTL